MMLGQPLSANGNPVGSVSLSFTCLISYRKIEIGIGKPLWLEREVPPLFIVIHKTELGHLFDQVGSIRPRLFADQKTVGVTELIETVVIGTKVNMAARSRLFEVRLGETDPTGLRLALKGWPSIIFSG